MKLVVSYKDNSNRKEKKKIMSHQMQYSGGGKILSTMSLTWIKEIAIYSKLLTQGTTRQSAFIPNKATKNLYLFIFLFYNHRQALERLCKSKSQEEEKVAFPIPLLSRKCSSCFYKYRFLIGKNSLLSFKRKMSA